MKKLFVLIFLVGCQNDGYPNHDLYMLPRYKAKETCSCMFVMNRDEEYCRAFTFANPNLATMSIDLEQKSIQAESLLYWSATAQWQAPKTGCVLLDE